MAGLVLPGDGPPEEVIRHYLALAKGEVSNDAENEAPQWRRPQHPSDEEPGEDEGKPGADGETDPDADGN